MNTYVTYEGLFAFMQMLFSLAMVITGVITLVTAKDKNNKKK